MDKHKEKRLVFGSLIVYNETHKTAHGRTVYSGEEDRLKNLEKLLICTRSTQPFGLGLWFVVQLTDIDWRDFSYGQLLLLCQKSEQRYI